MRKLLLITALCVLGLFNLNAQEPETITVGSGGETFTKAPTSVYHKYSMTQQIFLADEMQNKSGKITSVSFKCTRNVSNNTFTRTVKVYMVNTDKTSFSSNSDWVKVTEQDLVYDGTVTFTVNNWSTITLSTPFTYKKGKNLLLCVNDISNLDHGTASFAVDAKSDSRLLYVNDYYNGYDATNITASGTLASKLNHVKFTIVDDGSGEILDEAPDAPTGLTAKALSDTEIELSWTASEKATGYNVYKKGNEKAIASGISDTTYVVKDLTPGTNYCFTVTAVADQESEHSDEECVETLSKLTTFVFDFENVEHVEGSGLRVFQGPGASHLCPNWGTARDHVDGTMTDQLKDKYFGKDGSAAVYSMTYDELQTQFHTPDNYIVTEKSYLITETSTLEWDIRQFTEGKEDNYAIVVSENGTDFEIIWFERYTNATGETKAFSLADYADKELYIGFRHYQVVDGGALILDNIKLVTESTLTPEEDVDLTAPRVPDGVATVVWGTTEIKVKWNVAENATSYNIYCADTLVVKGVTETEYMVKNLEPSTTYCFTVTSANEDKESDKSSQVCATTWEEIPEWLPAPTNLKASYASEFDIKLTWDKVENAKTYRIYQDGQVIVNSTADTEWTVTNIEDKETEYCFEVTAVYTSKDGKEVESEKSKLCTSIADLENPTEPEPEDPEQPEDPENPSDSLALAAPVVTATATSDTTVVLTWNKVEGATSYNVFQGADTTAIATVEETTYTVTGLTAETEYTFTVTAANDTLESAKSAAVKVTTLAADEDGIEELSSAFNVYPNPVENELFIATEVNVKEIAIYDIYGRQTKVYGLQSTDDVHSINVADLNSGIYFVKVVTSEGEIVKRFVKK